MEYEKNSTGLDDLEYEKDVERGGKSHTPRHIWIGFLCYSLVSLPPPHQPVMVFGVVEDEARTRKASCVCGHTSVCAPSAALSSPASSSSTTPGGLNRREYERTNKDPTNFVQRENRNTSLIK